MKRTILSLLVVGLFAGVGTSAIADDVKAGSEPKANSRAISSEDVKSGTEPKESSRAASEDVKAGSEPKANSRAASEDVKSGSEPKANSRAIAPTETDSSAQQAAKSEKQTNPTKEDDAYPAK